MGKTAFRLALVLVVALVAPCACGGGGGGGDDGGNGNGGFALADIVGSWLGPIASINTDGEVFLAAGPGGMVIDAAGNVTGAGITTLDGTVTLTSAALGTYRFEGSGTSTGLVALLILSPGRNHLLFASDVLTLGAWERNATAFAPPYTDADLRNETWTGLACEVTPAMTTIDPESIAVVIDGAGSFTADTSSTNVAPLTVVETNKGAYTGDATDPGPPVETSNVVVLMTPDRQFVAIFSCLTGGSFPDDCSYAALDR